MHLVTFIIIIELARTTAFDEYITPNITWSPSIKQNVSCSANSNCYISCIGDNFCRYLTFDASKANNLYLTCNGGESCAGIDVFGPINGNLTINCNSSNINSSNTDSYGKGSCEFIIVSGGPYRNVNINCITRFDCYFGDFYLDNSEEININFNNKRSGYSAGIYAANVTKSVNILCNGIQSCEYAFVYCPLNTSSSCNIDCIDNSSCARMTYYIENSLNNNINITCHNDIGADCFIVDDGIFTYSSNIHCTDNNVESILEYNKYTNELSCHAACCPFEIEEINCGMTDNCIIDCRLTFCEGHIINATDKLSLNVLCSNSGSNISSTCDGLLIFCPFNGNCFINLNISFNAKNIVINGGSGINSNIELVCSNMYSCYYLTLNAHNTKTVVVNATDKRSLYLSDIHVENANKFDLYCDGILSDGEINMNIVCELINLYLSQNISNIASIYCVGKGCDKLKFYSSNGWIVDNMNLYIQSSCVCGNDNIGNCIDDSFYFYCGNNYFDQTYITPNDDNSLSGSSCYYNGILCGCDDFVNQLNQNYIDNDEIIENKYNIDCEYTTTTTDMPTVAPTTNNPTTTTSITNIPTTNPIMLLTNVPTTLITTDVVYTSNTNGVQKEKEGNGLSNADITGIILGIVGLCAFIVIFYYISNKKKSKKQDPIQKDGIQLYTAGTLPTSIDHNEEDDGNKLLTHDAMQTNK